MKSRVWEYYDVSIASGLCPEVANGTLNKGAKHGAKPGVIYGAKSGT